ncbi:MAG: zinc-binding alcohol dehydrogenase [Spirochaetaceae bacterium]|nr:zinc-binding alcohol dehydrogenase [Spirochaetaceae bacterium]
MPRELIAPAREQVAFRDYEREPLAPHQVRVRSEFGSAKHGTEMAFFKGYGLPRGDYDDELRIFTGTDGDGEAGGREPYPTGLGNMCTGEVIEAGAAVTGVRTGDRVFAHSGFREEHVWPADRVRVLPAGVPWQAAACLDPTDFALGAVRDGHVRIGDAVAVFGMGAIGLMALQLARLAGAHPVIAVDPIPLRREVASELGADITFDPSACDAGKEIRLATGRRGADVCIEYSGHHSGLQAALRGVRYLGTVVAGAFPGAYPAGLDLGAEAHFNRPTMVFSRACSEPNPEYGWDEERLFDVSWRLLTDGSLCSEPVVQPVVAFDDLLTEYPKIATAPEHNVKLGVRF